MNNSDANSTIRLAELLKHPDDLHKIPLLKSDFSRKKASVDAQLKLGLSEQLQLTKQGMTSLRAGQSVVAAIRDEMIKIDKLCAESQTLIHNFPEIDRVAQAHRNFAAVEKMQASIVGFDERLDEVLALLQADEEDMETQPNLMRVHYGISELRRVRDEAMEQVRRADDASLEETLQGVFRRLDDAIDDFDEHVGQACVQLIPLVQSGNTSLVVRLAIVIEEEEKFDTRIKELQEAKTEFGGLAQRFKSLATGPRELRGYKDKFLEAIKLSAQRQIEASDEAFMDDPDRLEKSLRWYFNDLNTVKLGMVNLMPKKWRIFRNYVSIYHKLMHGWLTRRAGDKEIAPKHMLAIIHWRDKYNAKMAKLGASAADLDPPLPGGRDSDLVREYSQLIVDKVEQWMDNMNRADRDAFVARDESSIDHDEHGRFRTKSLADMWRMLREQLLVASTAELADVTEGVTDAMFRALKTRQDMWTDMVNGELTRFTSPGSGAAAAEQPGLNVLQDWLAALANDQIVSIADADANFGDPGYLSSFRAEFSALVSADYLQAAGDKVETLKEAITDLGFRCVTVFVHLIFAVDFRAIMADFFTPAWYTTRGGGGSGGGLMGRIVSTFEDYLGDYGEILHPLLAELLVVELSKRLLAAYLGAVRNRAAKFPRSAPYNERLRDDVSQAFKFFERFPDAFADIKGLWRVLEAVTALVEADKHALVAEFRGFAQVYWDVKVGWVEALLRTRDDIDWGALGDGRGIMKGIRAEAAEVRVGGRPETIMSEVS